MAFSIGKKSYLWAALWCGCRTPPQYQTLKTQLPEGLWRVRHCGGGFCGGGGGQPKRVTTSNLNAMPLGKPPANKLPTKKRAAVKRMFERGVGVQAIADAHGVDRKTVYTWAKAGGWQRPGGGNQTDQGDQGDHDGGDQAIRTAVDPDSIDIDRILAETIMDLRAAITATQKVNDYRPISNLAMAVFRGIEAWERRHPLTPADLARLAIEMNTSPEDFQRELMEQWRLNNGND